MLHDVRVVFCGVSSSVLCRVLCALYIVSMTSMTQGSKPDGKQASHVETVSCMNQGVLVSVPACQHVGVAGVTPHARYSSKEQPAQQLIYLWTMGLQKAEPYVNCWMTERIQYTKPVNL